MIKKLILLSLVASVVAACGSSTGNNSTIYAEPPANSNVVSNVDANSLPPGVAASPAPPTAEETPVIPDPATLNKPFKPGATPTPGIPSQEELRRQLQRAANVVPPSTKGVP